MGAAGAVLLLLVPMMGASAPPAESRTHPPVTVEEERAFISAVEQRSAEGLSDLFSHRISQGRGVGQFELTSAGLFLREVEGCARHRVSRFRSDAELFVEWICPERPWRQPDFEAEGYVTMVWHHPAGLTLVYHPSGITVRPPGPPSSQIRPQATSRLSRSSLAARGRR